MELLYSQKSPTPIIPLNQLGKWEWFFKNIQKVIELPFQFKCASLQLSGLMLTDDVLTYQLP